jgi:YidC/Oxa1 family membrane protein insertase
MEKRTLIAIVLSILVLIVYQYLFLKPAQKRLPAKQPKPPEVVEHAKPAAPPAPVVVKPTPATETERLIKVETELYIATFTSKGGTVKTWQLKKYTDNDGLKIPLLKEDGLYPALGIGWNNDFTLSEANFNVIGNDLKLDSNNKTGSIVFEYVTPQYSIRRTYTFYFDKYKFDLKDEISGLPQYEITLGGDFGIFSKKEPVHVGPVILKDTDRIELKPKKLKETRLYTGNLKWIAQEDKYFCAAIVPITPIESAKAWKFQDSASVSFIGKPGVNEFMVYAGPKEHDRLKKLGVGLEHIVDFGFFSIIARPLFWILKKFHSVVGNYGWAIVLLTIVVRVPFIPIVNKGQRAMKRLQELQPRMQEIREKYKKDPQRMQKEMMELYRKHKVNPMGGCLPILLQIPVFFALYKVLLIAIELRGAPFMLWITDLSQKDPYYILPIVMGITMVIQQKMTPSAGDPKQQKLMMFMPVIFTFLFLNFASGLVLYWLVNNLLSIAQQIYVNKKKTA